MAQVVRAIMDLFGWAKTLQDGVPQTYQGLSMSHRIGQSKTPLKFCRIFGGAHFYFVSLSLSFGVVLALAYLFSHAGLLL